MPVIHTNLGAHPDPSLTLFQVLKLNSILIHEVEFLWLFSAILISTLSWWAARGIESLLHRDPKFHSPLQPNITWQQISQKKEKTP